MRARTLCCILGLVLAAAIARGQDTLALKRTARVAPDQPVTLADIAALTGPGAGEIAALVVVEVPTAQPTDNAGWFRVDLDEVHALLDEHLGEAAGMVAVSGSVCHVRALGSEPAEQRSGASAKPTKAAPDATEVVRETTIRGAVARELARLLRADPASMRLVFEPADAEYLGLPTAGSVLEITTAGASERLPVVVTRYNAAGRADKRTVRVTVEIEQSVAVVARVVTRGEQIKADDVTAETRWSNPADQFVTPAEAVGSIARRKLEPGQRIDVHMVEPPVVIARGDLVEVRVFCNGLVVTRLAHALRDGVEGESIDLAAQDQPRQRLRATVVGPGQAAVNPPRLSSDGITATGTPLANGDSAG